MNAARRSSGLVLALLLSLAPRAAHAGEAPSMGDIYLGLAATSGTLDYGHRLERRHGLGIGFGTRLVLAAPVGPVLLGGTFTADAFGGPMASSLDTWTGVYVNYRLDWGPVVGFDAGGLTLLFSGGGGLAADTAYYDDMFVTHLFGRVRTSVGGHTVDAGFAVTPERNMAQWHVGGLYVLGPKSMKYGISWELRHTFGTASQNGGLSARAAFGIAF